MLLNVVREIAIFEKHLKDNMGKPIDLNTIAAFARMADGVVRAILGVKG